LGISAESFPNGNYAAALTAANNPRLRSIREITMTARFALFAFAIGLGLCSAAPAFADADDAAWIKRCVADNADQNQAPTIVAAYCSCMNNKMSSSETQSVTTWEKSHPKERESCSAEAGWK
jgi:hypothetical protein